jgi:transcriptional regulator with XRE-family HTH domain
MTTRTLCRRTIHWAARMADLRARHNGSAHQLAEALGVGYETVSAWLWRGKLPGLALAVRASNRSGYTLERLVGQRPLPRRRDYAPHDATYSLLDWPRALRVALPGESDNAISARICACSLVPDRVPEGWLYGLRVPLLASVVETADALGFDVDTLLALGRASAEEAA